MYKVYGTFIFVPDLDIGTSGLETQHCLLTYYTESQKKLIASLECHPLKSKASTWIIFGHRLGKFILNKHIWKKQKFTSIIEEINAMKSQGVNKKKSQKLLASWVGSSKQTKADTAFT